MLARGCQQTPAGRIRIPQRLIEEMTAFQRKTQPADQRDQELHYLCGVDWAHHIVWNGKQDEMRRRLASEVLMSAAECRDRPRNSILDRESSRRLEGRAQLC